MVLDPVLSSRKDGTEIRGRESAMKPSSAWLLGLFVLSALFATASAEGDVDVHSSCAICGMDREAFGHSRMLIVFQDGASFGTCRLPCAALILMAEGGWLAERGPHSRGGWGGPARTWKGQPGKNPADCPGLTAPGPSGRRIARR